MLLAVALVVVVASCGTGAALLSGGRSVLAAFALSLSSSPVTSSWLLCSVEWLDRYWGLLHGSVIKFNAYHIQLLPRSIPLRSSSASCSTSDEGRTAALCPPPRSPSP